MSETDDCPDFGGMPGPSDAQPKSMNVERQPYDFHNNQAMG
jgi:hypothetical protein